MNYNKNRIRKINKEMFINVYLSKYKKVRGLKRAVRKIEAWKKENIDFKMEKIQNEKRYYLKLSFSPFFNVFCNKTPPLWYQRVMMKALYEIYMNWAKELSESDKRFYIKIWILKGDFMSSKIVVALDEEIENFPSFYKENPISEKNSLNSFFDKFPFLDTMFIIPLLQLSKINTYKDNVSEKEFKRLSKISIEIFEEKDNSKTLTYPVDTILLCTH